MINHQRKEARMVSQPKKKLKRLKKVRKVEKMTKKAVRTTKISQSQDRLVKERSLKNV